MTQTATTPAVSQSPASKRPKSPPAPSSSLKDCVTDVRKLYDTYTRGSFSRAELASTLDVAADSGPTAQRIFSLKEFGLLSSEGEKFKVTEDFIQLKNAKPSSVAFKRAAYQAVTRSKLFKELLDGFHSKLPPRNAVAMRLEEDKKFNKARATAIAGVLEESLKFAGVLDGNGNIVEPRDGSADAQDDDDRSATDTNNSAGTGTRIGANPKSGGAATPGALTLEIALKENRRAVVVYPPDLAPEEAEKIGNVLKAVVA